MQSLLLRAAVVIPSVGLAGEGRQTQSLVAMRALCWLAIVFMLGCARDECRPQDANCEGNEARTCSAHTDNDVSSHYEWSSEVCGTRTCRTTSWHGVPWALCAIRSDPDPLCEGGDESRCDGETLVDCRAGYRVKETRCPFVCADLRAVVKDYGCGALALCAMSKEVDPLCARTVFSQCDGGKRIECTCGHRVSQASCPTETTCRATTKPIEGAPGATFTTAACQ